MRFFLKSYLIIFLFWIFSACANPKNGENSQLLWGHLGDAGLSATAPQFLINKEPGQSYKICLAEYMEEALPGIKQELYAAANIWASYLKRNIKVNIDVKDLPRGDNDLDHYKLTKQYYTECGNGYDVVIGMSAMESFAIGMTGASYSYYKNNDGSLRITDFQRFLFLRDYSLSPDQARDDKTWISLSEHIGEAYSDSGLLSLMTSRSRVEFEKNDRPISLPTFVHEFGHVWGLCDQYQSANNCDPSHASNHKVSDSIMGAASERAQLYLTNDDINGIRELAKRPGFTHNWPEASSFAAAPPPIVKKDVEFLEFSSLKADGQKLVANYSVFTNKPGKYELQVWVPSQNQWTSLRGYYDSPDAGFRLNEQIMTITGFSPAAGMKIRLKLTLKNEQGSWKEPVYKESPLLR